MLDAQSPVHASCASAVPVCDDTSGNGPDPIGIVGGIVLAVVLIALVAVVIGRVTRRR